MATANGSTSPNGRWRAYATYTTSTSNTAVSISVSATGLYIIKNGYSTSNWVSTLNGKTTSGTSTKGGTTGNYYPSGLTTTASKSRGKTATTLTVPFSWQCKGGTVDPGTSSGTITVSVPVLPNYKVTYSKNCDDDVTGMPGDATKWYNETLNLSTAIPVRSGYEFLGWGATSTATTYITTYTANKAATIYAIWKRKTSIKTKVNGAWKETEAYTKVNGAWKPIIASYSKINGEWKEC